MRGVVVDGLLAQAAAAAAGGGLAGNAEAEAECTPDVSVRQPPASRGGQHCQPGVGVCWLDLLPGLKQHGADGGPRPPMRVDKQALRAALSGRAGTPASLATASSSTVLALASSGLATCGSANRAR